MAPALPVTGAAGDEDDSVQLYFLPEDDDDDPWCPPTPRHLLPGPGEDIWKKFELLTTPSLSPRRRSSALDDPPLAAEQLLDSDHSPPGAPGAPGPSTSHLQSFIIRDCMWSSSFAAADKLQQVVSQRLRMDKSERAAEGRGSEVEGSARSTQSSCVCFDSPVTVCGGLDSSPLSQSGEEQEEQEEQEEVIVIVIKEEEEKEEEDEEEVDVVTVEQRRTSPQPTPDSAPLVLKHSFVNTHQHNYAAPQPAGKRKRRILSSDFEDSSERRRAHNDLERHRRNELNASFQVLRDEVPSIARNDKAAKALILKMAAEFIRQMRTDEKKLLATKAELKKRAQELRRRGQELSGRGQELRRRGQDLRRHGHDGT